MQPANRFAAYLVIVLATLSGGGSLLIFGAFLIAGPFTVIHLNISEPQALLWAGALSAVFFLQHSGMIRSSFRTWLSSIIPAHYYAATHTIASAIVLTAVVLLWQPSRTTLFEVLGLCRCRFVPPSSLPSQVLRGAFGRSENSTRLAESPCYHT